MKILSKPVTLILMAGMVLSACSTSVSNSSDKADCQGLPAGQQIKIEAPWARTTASSGMDGGMDMAQNSAAYMVIHNCGTEADELISAASSVSGMTTLMTTEIKNGTASMYDVDKIEIPAGGKVELKPGGYHVMLMGLKNGLMAGDVVELKLEFTNAGEVAVQAAAKAP